MPKKSTIKAINAIKYKSTNKKVAAFITYANAEIVKLKDLIAQYNALPEPTETAQILQAIEKLKEINTIRKELEDKYPQEFKIVEFQQEIRINLFNELRAQFTALGITSMHENAILAGPPNLATAPIATIEPFADLIANLAPEKVGKILEILSAGATFNIVDLENLYLPTEAEYTQYKTTLAQYNIQYLGGSNSKNFKITPLYNSTPAFVLKVDNRLGMTSHIDTHLRTHSLSDVLTPIEAVRQHTYNDTSGRQKTNRLLITALCTGGSPDEYARTLPDSALISSAIHIYSQMGDILTKISADGCVFLDMKNSNWLLDKNGDLHIADTKSFRFASNETFIVHSPDNEDYDITYSLHMNPPEINDMTFSVDKMNTYMLGKNLYQYLTGCSANSLTKLDFNSTQLFPKHIFSTDEWRVLEMLIRNMLDDNPAYRPTLKEALTTLKNISLLATRSTCNALITKINLIKPTNDQKLNLLVTQLALEIDNASDIAKLTSIKQELEAQLLPLQITHTKEKCNTTLQNMRTTMDPTDQKLNEFISLQTTKLHNAQDINVITAIDDEINMVRIILDNYCSTYNKLLARITASLNAPTLSLNAPELSDHYKELLIKTQQELLNLDITERANSEQPIIKYTATLTDLNKLQTAIAACDTIITDIRHSTPNEDTKTHALIQTKIQELDNTRSIYLINNIKNHLNELLQKTQETHHKNYFALLKESGTPKKNASNAYTINMRLVKRQLLELSNADRITGSAKLTQLAHSLDTIKKIEEKYSRCKKIIAEINSYKISDNDQIMQEFVKNKTTAINEAQTIEEISTLATELDDSLSKVQASQPIVAIIKKIFTAYQDDKSFYKIGKKNKGDAIEQAILQVPIEKRGEEILTAPEGKELREALATRRGVISDTIPRLADGQIDEKKAATPFIEFKKRVQELKNSEQVALNSTNANEEELPVSSHKINTK